MDGISWNFKLNIYFNGEGMHVKFYLGVISYSYCPLIA